MPSYLDKIEDKLAVSVGNEILPPEILLWAHTISLIHYPAFLDADERERCFASYCHSYAESLGQPSLPEGFVVDRAARTGIEKVIGTPIDHIPEALRQSLGDIRSATLSALFGGSTEAIRLLRGALSETQYSSLFDIQGTKVAVIGCAVGIFRSLAAYNEDELPKGASISKALSLAARWNGVSYRTAMDYWKELKPIAHLVAAQVEIARKQPGTGTGALSIGDMGPLLALARDFEQFLLGHKSEAVGPDDIWRIPKLVFRYFPSEHLPPEGWVFPVPQLPTDEIELLRREFSKQRGEGKAKRAQRDGRLPH